MWETGGALDNGNGELLKSRASQWPSPPAVLWPWADASREQSRGGEGRPEWWVIVQTKRHGEHNQAAGEGTPKVPVPHCYSPLGGLEQSARELGGETSRAREGADSPRRVVKGILWVGQPAGPGQGSQQWGGS